MNGQFKEWVEIPDWRKALVASYTANVKLAYDTEAVQQFCHKHGISRLELFGSALREDFRGDSDVDLMATLRPEADAHCGLFEWVEMKDKLEHIFGRSVDLVSRKAIERSRNPYRKASILAHTEALYVER